MSRAVCRRAGLVASAIVFAAVPALSAEVVFERPGLIASIGQSSDIAIVKVLLNTQLKLGLDYKPLAAPGDLAGMKTLVVVVGASTKGLGSAGLDLAKEATRARALVAAAREQGVRILALHTGGEARRGKTSNDLLSIVVPEADCVVVVAAGNKDRLFHTLAAARKTPVVEVERLPAVGEAVRAIFRN